MCRVIYRLKGLDERMCFFDELRNRYVATIQNGGVSNSKMTTLEVYFAHAKEVEHKSTR